MFLENETCEVFSSERMTRTSLTHVQTAQHHTKWTGLSKCIPRHPLVQNAKSRKKALCWGVNGEGLRLSNRPCEGSKQGQMRALWCECDPMSGQTPVSRCPNELWFGHQNSNSLQVPVSFNLYWKPVRQKIIFVSFFVAQVYSAQTFNGNQLNESQRHYKPKTTQIHYWNSRE